MQVMWCAGCQDETPFEVPPCEDGHGADCLDLACLACGHAVVVGLYADDPVAVLEVAAA
jgi:hypothetical protein